ncbi:SusC/RagA family TonB-linked outer membrane protein [Rhodohalobacter sulfatireducens]|nr:TonB-dependent receptor [Rhodohalobacter sulfatireducens]
MAQSHNVTGSVISSDNGEALPGVNILVIGTETGTTTDLNGEFSLAATSADDTLAFSFIGYERVEEPINGRTVIDIALTPQAIAGEELVVVGYGAVQRRDITGSVSSISNEQIREVPITDAGQALQGRTPGVVALSSGNRPGQGMTLRIRGRRSLTASNDPLFVVDGVPVEGNINDINPQDIESMEVLKDASATAIYGSRGANGVVLVTTNRGGDYPTQVSYSGYGGISQTLGTPDMMTGAEFAEMKKISGRSLTPAEEDAITRGVSTDWDDLLLEDGYQTSHQLSVNGGNENTQFAISGNFFFDKGVISTQDFNRNTLRLNLDHSISEKLRVGTSTQLSHQVQNWGSNPYGESLATNPLAEPYNEDGSLDLRPGADPLIFNPLADLEDGAYIDERERARIFSNVYADLNMLENLNLRVNFGSDLQDWRRGLFQGSETVSRNGQSPYSQKDHERRFTYTWENILTYIQDFGNIHSLTATGLFSIQQSRTEWTNLGVSDLPYEHQQFHNLDTGATVEGFGSDLEEWGLMSYMGRVNYQLKDRYLFTVTGRYDGSSRLADESKWGFFPSAAIGWRISNESFMAEQDLFSELKLRVSYGVTGNTAIDPYQTRGGLSRTVYSFTDQAGFGFRPSELSNPNLQWETSATANLGLDFGLWNDRIVGSFEIYQTNTKDLLLRRAIPITSGFDSVFENIGETKNSGIEFSITSRNVSNRDFSWSTNLNLFANNEEIISLYGTGEDDIGNGWFIGEPITVWYDYEKTGIWQSNEEAQAADVGREPGEIKVVDQNGDGRINEEDRKILGSDIPTLTGSIINNFRYKSFDLSVFLFGSFGHTIFNSFKVSNNTMQGRYNNLDIDYWTESNPTNKGPKPDGTRESPLNGSTLGYMPGDFLKVRNIQLGYSLPQKLLGRVDIRSARIYVNAETPFVFSHLEDGVDPEIQDQQADPSNGGEINARTPSRRLFSFGVEINF